MISRNQYQRLIEKLCDWSRVNVHVPLDWTTEQADEMLTILGRIEEELWIIYGDEIVELESHRALRKKLVDDDYIEDDIPF